MASYPYQGTKKFNSFNVDGVSLVTVFAPGLITSVNDIFGVDINDLKKGSSGGVFFPSDSNSEMRAYPVFPKGIDHKPLSYYYEARYGTQYSADNPAPPYDSWKATTKTDDLGPLWKLTGSPENTIKGLKNTGRGAGIHVNYDGDTGNVRDQFWVEVQTKSKTINNHDYLNENKLWEQDDIIGYWGKANTVLLNQNPENYIQSFHEYIKEAVNSWGYDNTIKSLFKANDTVVCWTDKIDDMIKYQNAIWQYREKLFAPFIQKFSH